MVRYFLQLCLSVILSTAGSYLTITHVAFDLTQLASPRRGISLYKDPSGHSLPSDMFKHVQLGPHCAWTPPPSPDIFIIKYIQLASRRFSSHWNAYLIITMNNSYLKVIISCAVIIIIYVRLAVYNFSGLIFDMFIIIY